MSYALPFNSAYYSGAATSSDTRFDVAIGGHGYMVDTKYMQDFGRQSIDMLRQQSDTGDKPSEASLNPAGLWRRAQDSWHHGAGQEWYDKPDSDPYRFRTSKGVNVWDKWGLSLLPDTQASVLDGSGPAIPNIYLTVSSGRLYRSYNQAISCTSVGGVSLTTPCTGLPAAQVTSLTSDGTTVFAAFGASGVYVATGGTVFSSYWTGTADLVRHMKSRLMVAGGATIYNPTSGPAALSSFSLYTHPIGGWTWTDFADGQSCIYASGYSGDKSIVYRIGIGTTGTSLDQPIVAATIPDGEIVRSLTGYLGYLVLGTDKGLRFAVSDTAGNLTLGSLIETSSPVLCAEGQERFVWYGLTNYDSTSTGLGRLDLSTFTSDLTPAYASDLMAASTGTITGVATYLGKRYFAISGTVSVTERVGVWREADTLLASGTLTTGRITYGIPDTKTAVQIHVRHDLLPAAAAVQVALSSDSAAATVVGTSDIDGTVESSEDQMSPSLMRGTYYEATLTLTGSITLRRLTLEVDPSAKRTSIFQVPLRLFPEIELVDGVGWPVDVQAEFTYLLGLLQSRQVVTYQEGDDSYRVVLDDYTWRPAKRGRDFWSGTFTARMKEL